MLTYTEIETLGPFLRDKRRDVLQVLVGVPDVQVEGGLL